MCNAICTNVICVHGSEATPRPPGQSSTPAPGVAARTSACPEATRRQRQWPRGPWRRQERIDALSLSLSFSLSDETFHPSPTPLTAHLNVYVDSVDHRPCSATRSRSLSLALWPPASSSVALWRASVRCEEIVRSTVSRSFRPPPTTSPPPTSQTILYMSSGGRRGGRASLSTATAEKIRLGLRTAVRTPYGRPNSVRPSELVSFHIPGHPTSPYRYCVLHMVIWTRRRGLRKTRRRAATDEPRSLISLSLFPSLALAPLTPSPPQPSRRTATACSSP